MDLVLLPVGFEALYLTMSSVVRFLIYALEITRSAQNFETYRTLISIIKLITISGALEL